MPISHETLLLAKKYAEQLHAGGGTHYTGGHGIIVEGEAIEIDKDVVAQQTDIHSLTQSIVEVETKANTNQTNIANANQSISQLNQGLSSTTQSLNQNVTRIDEEIDDLQNQINNIENGSANINYPITGVNKLGMMKPGQGLTASIDGTVKVNLEGYLDRNSGVLFLNPQESKLVNLKDACTAVYLDHHLVDNVNVASGRMLYLQPGENKVGNYLIGTFNSAGTAFTVSNSHTTNGMFILWGTNYTQT